ncbi:MAG: hypothetical protein ACO225_03245 [Ilumatobacteraceae bacterium]
MRFGAENIGRITLTFNRCERHLVNVTWRPGDQPVHIPWNLVVFLGIVEKFGGQRWGFRDRP